jgi:hypothetical protein
VSEVAQASVKKGLKIPTPDWYFDPDNPFGSKPKKEYPTALKPLTPITNEEFWAMHEKARWDSIVALRGPDLAGSNTVKWLTTSVIRYRMSGVTNTHGTVNDKMPFVVLPADIPDRSGQFDWHHFCGHVYESATHLGIPTTWVPWSVWKAATQRGNYQQGLCLLTSVLKDPFREWIMTYLANSWGYTEANVASIVESLAKKEASSCE